MAGFWLPPDEWNEDLLGPRPPDMGPPTQAVDLATRNAASRSRLAARADAAPPSAAPTPFSPALPWEGAPKSSLAERAALTQSQLDARAAELKLAGKWTTRAKELYESKSADLKSQVFTAESAKAKNAAAARGVRAPLGGYKEEAPAWTPPPTWAPGGDADSQNAWLAGPTETARSTARAGILSVPKARAGIELIQATKHPLDAIHNKGLAVQEWLHERFPSITPSPIPEGEPPAQIYSDSGGEDPFEQTRIADALDASLSIAGPLATPPDMQGSFAQKLGEGAGNLPVQILPAAALSAVPGVGPELAMGWAGAVAATQTYQDTYNRAVAMGMHPQVAEAIATDAALFEGTTGSVTGALPAQRLVRAAGVEQGAEMGLEGLFRGAAKPGSLRAYAAPALAGGTEELTQGTASDAYSNAAFGDPLLGDEPVDSALINFILGAAASGAPGVVDAYNEAAEARMPGFTTGDASPAAPAPGPAAPPPGAGPAQPPPPPAAPQGPPADNGGGGGGPIFTGPQPTTPPGGVPGVPPEVQAILDRQAAEDAARAQGKPGATPPAAAPSPVAPTPTPPPPAPAAPAAAPEPVSETQQPEAPDAVPVEDVSPQAAPAATPPVTPESSTETSQPTSPTNTEQPAESSREPAAPGQTAAAEGEPDIFAATNERIAARKQAIASFKQENGEASFEAPANGLAKEREARIIISRDIDEPGKWRYTIVDKDGPSSHSVRDTWDEAVNEAVAEYGMDLGNVKMPNQRPRAVPNAEPPTPGRTATGVADEPQARGALHRGFRVTPENRGKLWPQAKDALNVVDNLGYDSATQAGNALLDDLQGASVEEVLNRLDWRGNDVQRARVKAWLDDVVSRADPQDPEWLSDWENIKADIRGRIPPDDPRRGLRPAGAPEPWQVRWQESDLTKGLHRQAVRAALRAGKPVPPEVIADYPGVEEEAASAPSPSEPGAPKPARPKIVTPQVPGRSADAAPDPNEDFSFESEPHRKSLQALVDSGASIEEIAAHPLVMQAAAEEQGGGDAEPTIFDLDDPEYLEKRVYDFNGERVVGAGALADKMTDVARAYSTKGPVKKQRLAFILTGSPAAGKSTIARELADELYAAAPDSDDAKKHIPGHRKKYADSGAHGESAQIAAMTTSRLAEDGTNLVLQTIGTNADDVDALAKQLEERGYRVQIRHVDVDPDVAARRAVKRFLETRRFVSPLDIRSWAPDTKKAALELAGRGRNVESRTSEEWGARNRTPGRPAGGRGRPNDAGDAQGAGEGGSEVSADAEAGAEPAGKAPEVGGQPPTSRGATPEGSPSADGLPPPGKVGEMPIANLRVDPARFQYKIGGDEKGITSALTGKKWDPNIAGVILVWRDPADGNVYVINGHHRYQFAKNHGVKTLDVRNLDVATDTEARTVGAMANIAEGRGSDVDAAKVFRDSGYTREQLEEKGLSMGEAKVRNGLILSGLDESLFQLVSMGQVPVGDALAIGENLRNHAQQFALWKQIESERKKGRNVTQALIRELAKEVEAAGTATVEQENLFGTQAVEESLVFERADIRAYIRERLSKEKRAFSAVAPPERAATLEAAGNVIDREANERKAKDTTAALELFDKLSTMSGSHQDVLRAAALRLKNRDGAPGAIKSDAYDAYLAALRAESGAAQAPGEGSGGERGGGPGGEAEGQGGLFGEAAPAGADAVLPAADDEAERHLDAEGPSARESIVDRLKVAADEARARIDARKSARGKPGLGDESGKTTIFDDLADFSIIGAYHIVKTGADFEAWSKEMIASLGERVRPHLKSVYVDAKRAYEKAVKPPGSTAERDKAKRRIRNLLMLAHDPNAGEATSADEKAAELMDKHWVSLEDAMPEMAGSDAFTAKQAAEKAKARRERRKERNQREGAAAPPPVQDEMFGQGPPPGATPNAAPSQPPPPAFDIYEMDRRDMLRQKMQDSLWNLWKQQQEIEKVRGPLSDEANAYMAQERVAVGTANQSEKFLKDEARPFMLMMGHHGVKPYWLNPKTGERVDPKKAKSAKEMDKAGFHLTDDFALYLRARHAAERNAYIASINEKMPDGGSGMTNAEAEAVMERLERDGRRGAMETLAAKLDAMLEETRALLEREGLATDETVQAWRDAYQFYVPLHGYAADATLGREPSRTGRGSDVRGKESKDAKGRQDVSASPWQNVILDRLSAIERARKNRWLDTLGRMIEENPNRELWDVFSENNPDTTRRLTVWWENPITGQKSSKPVRGWNRKAEVSDVVANAMFDNDYIGFKRNGQQFFIGIRGNGNLRRAIKNANADKVNEIVQILRPLTAWYALVNTGLDLTFAFGNIARDVQTAIASTVAEQSEGGRAEGKHVVGQTLKYIPGAGRAIWRDASGFDIKDPEWVRYVEDFQEDGAGSGFFSAPDPQELQKQAEKLMALGAGGTTAQFKEYARVFKEMLLDINKSVENSTRLALYRSLREAGVSRHKAASVAKNATVNFNRKGDYGATFNALYLFFGANVQSSLGTMYRIFTSKNAKRIAGSLATLGVLQALLGQWMADDDDDDINLFDKISDHDKSRNFIIPIDGGRAYYKIPVGYGLNVPFVAAQAMTDVLMGKRSPGQAAMFAGDAALAAVTPFGISEGSTPLRSALKTMTPTAARAAAELGFNENFYGAPITHEQRGFETTTPDSSRSFRSTTETAKAAAEFLNDVTGGNLHEKGLLDVSPDTLEFAAETALGGLGRVATGTFATVEDATDPGKDVDWSRAPLVKKFYGHTRTDIFDSHLYYERRERINQKLDHAKSIKDATERRRYIEENKGYLALGETNRKVGLVSPVDETDARLSDLRKAQDELMDSIPRTPEEAAAIDRKLLNIETRIDEEYKRFNKLYNKHVGRFK